MGPSRPTGPMGSGGGAMGLGGGGVLGGADEDEEFGRVEEVGAVDEPGEPGGPSGPSGLSEPHELSGPSGSDRAGGNSGCGSPSWPRGFDESGETRRRDDSREPGEAAARTSGPGGGDDGGVGSRWASWANWVRETEEGDESGWPSWPSWSSVTRSVEADAEEETQAAEGVADESTEARLPGPLPATAPAPMPDVSSPDLTSAAPPDPMPTVSSPDTVPTGRPDPMPAAFPGLPSLAPPDVASAPLPDLVPAPDPIPTPVPDPTPPPSAPLPTTPTPVPVPPHAPVPVRQPDPIPVRLPEPDPNPDPDPEPTLTPRPTATPSPAPDPTAAPTPLPFAGLLSHGEPSALYRQLRREHGEVVPVVLDGGVPAWLVLGYRELHQVTCDPGLFSRDSELWNQWPDIPPDWPLSPVISRRQPSILGTTGERHRSRATMIVEALETVDPFELRSHVERFADELIDAVCEIGQADLISQYAALLPVRVLTMLLGFPEEHGPGLVTALNDILDSGDRARPAEAFLMASITRLITERGERPSDDVVSLLLSNTAGFTGEEVTHDLKVILAAGHQPTADWIGNSLRLMLTDERFAASLFGGRSSVAEAMNEVLWEDTPIQNSIGRWATRDTRLGGRTLRTGDLVLLGFQSANSDPRVRTDGSALTGGNNAHFSFGHGEHRCPFPAQEIAEVIARTGIEVVLDRLPDLDLAVPPETLAGRSSPWLSGLMTLPVRFSPRPPLGRR